MKNMKDFQVLSFLCKAPDILRYTNMMIFSEKRAVILTIFYKNK